MFASVPLPAATPCPASHGEWVDIQGERCLRINDVHLMPPFLMNLVSACDLWMFVASNGGLTAGRRDADGALFPYQTVDRVYDSAGLIGPATRLQIQTPTGGQTWNPLAAPDPADPHQRRHLAKNVTGDRLWFEAIHGSRGLAFRQGWSTTEAHGFVRECELRNTGDQPVSLRLLDGLRHILPAGVSQRLQSNSSNLADAYKTAELRPDSRLAVYALAAGIVDRPMPLESLRASVVWSRGLPDPAVLLSDRQLPAWHRGEPVETETRRRGERAAYWLATDLTLAPGQAVRWFVVADTGLDQIAVTRLEANLNQADPVAASREATRELRALIGAADGVQAGGDETFAAHHFANVLFNVLRGGTFLHGVIIPRDDFLAHLDRHAPAAAARHAAVLQSWPDTLARAEWLTRIATRGDAQVTRLAREYLPLGFSRRHGDPSRPWNRFAIHLRDEAGRRRLTHEGNWRDIFQNWEALCLSYPMFFDAVIARFLNASTADGFNPYRLSQAGIDWEVPDPEDPWSSIGYWGDHQVIYLLKLLEWADRHQPAALPAALHERAFSYANVPYRLADYERMRQNPRDTLDFDHALHREIETRVATEGADARLVPDGAGGVLQVSLLEKLLVLTTTRLTHLIPDGGIWMNTQRPEWNDANNALVGYGVSVVTLAYLHRFLAYVRRVFGPALGSEPLTVSAPVAKLTQALHGILGRYPHPRAGDRFDDPHRRALVDELAAAGTHYRHQVYAGGLTATAPLAPEIVAELWARAQALVAASLRANQRPDSLFHAYNLLEFTDAPAGLALHRLPLMLEGQVAVLSAGLLEPAEVVTVLEALRRSALYRADQHSYLLYPDQPQPEFLARNVIPANRQAACPWLGEMVAAGDARLVGCDAAGRWRFHADIVNADALRARLDALARDPRWAGPAAASRETVEALHEEVFRHRRYTGRSGSMFAFEGLGSIYWHMVAKLLLAVQENLSACEDAPVHTRLVELYHDIRSGLGFNKSPGHYGAFPPDPYSHTPGHAGAQQPGMTGQVKEEILTRFGELGVTVQDGRVGFHPILLRAGEFTTGPTVFMVPDARGAVVEHALPADALAFTYAGVPVIYRRSEGPAGIRIDRREGGPIELPGGELTAEWSASLWARDDRIRRIEVNLGAGYQPLG